MDSARKHDREAGAPLPTLLFFVFGLALSFGVSDAAVPPDTMNYQGVLRDAAGDPLDGNFDMIFLFFDSASAGNEILLDQHLASGSGAVSVSGGLFNVALGSGSVVDGSGPGYYSTLSDVFRNYGALWLEIEVAGERLSPRVKVLNAGYAHNAGSLEGRPAAEFIDTSTSSQTKNGNLTLDGGSATGLIARGALRGGAFEDTDSSGYAYLANGDYGLRAYGDAAGGYFEDSSGSGHAWVGVGDDGIRGHGYRAGGYFADLDSSGYAYIAIGERGLNALGNDVGGYLKDRNNSGRSWVGFGDRGIEAIGDEMGGAFKDGDGTGIAYVGVGDEGIRGYGTAAGGYFEDSDNTGYGWIGRFNTGAEFYANDAGVYSSDLTSGVFARLAFDGSSTQGNGTKNFVQNHPDDRTKVIVYSALEGDETGTYTRGSGRLVNGRAVVTLGETFRLVTHPTIGLTAHLTARGEALLWVESVSTEELIVRGPEGFDLPFDYVVYGLRIGFEDLPVVQERRFDAYIPRLEEVTAAARERPEIAGTTPKARFLAMQNGGIPPAAVDDASARAMIDKIGIFDPQRNRPPARAKARTAAVPNPTVGGGSESVRRASTADAPIGAPFETIPRIAETSENGEEEKTYAEVPAPPIVEALFPISEDVTAGDLLVLDEQGAVKPALLTADRSVVGVASSAPIDENGIPKAPVGVFGVLRIKADADFGEIRPGDLLCSSTTPGHAMRSFGEVPGTIIGKALEPLARGRGVIRVLLMFR